MISWNYACLGLCVCIYFHIVSGANEKGNATKDLLLCKFNNVCYIYLLQCFYYFLVYLYLNIMLPVATCVAASLMFFNAMLIVNLVWAWT